MLLQSEQNVEMYNTNWSYKTYKQEMGVNVFITELEAYLYAKSKGLNNVAAFKNTNKCSSQLTFSPQCMHSPID